MELADRSPKTISGASEVKPRALRTSPLNLLIVTFFCGILKSRSDKQPVKMADALTRSGRVGELSVLAGPWR